MKDIMTDCSIEEARSIASDKWHQYNKPFKETGKSIYKDLGKVYGQVRRGRKIIDINKVMVKAGNRKTAEPRLAIALASEKKVRCMYSTKGEAIFLPEGISTWKEREKYSVKVTGMPTFSWQDKNQWKNYECVAPVPLIPPRLLPKKLTDAHYILWEVDVWEMVPPTDPYLLERITSNVFVILAGWDLTEIEKMAMAGRMY
jgi:hypothetical protein